MSKTVLSLDYRNLLFIKEHKQHPGEETHTHTQATHDITQNSKA